MATGSGCSHLGCVMPCRTRQCFCGLTACESSHGCHRFFRSLGVSVKAFRYSAHQPGSGPHPRRLAEQLGRTAGASAPVIDNVRVDDRGLHAVGSEQVPDSANDCCKPAERVSRRGWPARRSPLRPPRRWAWTPGPRGAPPRSRAPRLLPRGRCFHRTRGPRSPA